MVSGVPWRRSATAATARAERDGEERLMRVGESGWVLCSLSVELGA